jgi:ATP-binding cassette subfamily B protein
VQSASGVRRITDFLQEQPAIVDVPGALELPPVKDSIIFEDVSFTYAAGQPQISRVNLRINHGSYLVIGGPSGTGKSTLLALLLRLYDPDSGSIRIDGHDLRSVSVASLRRRIGVVFQESVLFNITLRENIRLGKLDATDAEVESAAHAADIHAFIASLPQGYDSPAGERGLKLSGGQRQRIAIARAILRDPSILLLDEATSALDDETEDAVNATIARLARGRTVIAVTHRPEKLVDANSFVMFDHGTVRERDRHRRAERLSVRASTATLAS